MGKPPQICIFHAFMIQDIDTSIGVFDVSDEDYLFMKKNLLQMRQAMIMTVLYSYVTHWLLLTGFCLLERDL